MRYGATPHRKDARGAGEPRLFLKKKEGKKDKPKTVFSAGDYSFLRKGTRKPFFLFFAGIIEKNKFLGFREENAVENQLSGIFTEACQTVSVHINP